MSCISPMAPLRETAHGVNPDSTATIASTRPGSTPSPIAAVVIISRKAAEGSPSAARSGARRRTSPIRIVQKTRDRGGSLLRFMPGDQSHGAGWSCPTPDNPLHRAADLSIAYRPSSLNPEKAGGDLQTILGDQIAELGGLQRRQGLERVELLPSARERREVMVIRRSEDPIEPPAEAEDLGHQGLTHAQGRQHFSRRGIQIDLAV